RTLPPPLRASAYILTLRAHILSVQSPPNLLIGEPLRLRRDCKGRKVFRIRKIYFEIVRKHQKNLFSTAQRPKPPSRSGAKIEKQTTNSKEQNRLFPKKKDNVLEDWKIKFDK